MSVLLYEVRSGAYHDSVVLLQLQSALSALPGILESGVVMATEANLSLLGASSLLPDEKPALSADDLLVAVRAESEAAGRDALAAIDSLLVRRGGGEEETYRPRSLRAAVRQMPEARWVLVSVPGRFAAGVARQALDLGRNVFLYSDNVSLEEEIDLKERAQEKGLVVMGPDCGTAIVGGTGLGFANRVRRGGVGLVAASGTGLQTVLCHLHALGAGVSQALGTGGRDLGDGPAGTTALQALDLLARDPATEVIVLLGKPPAPSVARRLLVRAQAIGRPVVVGLLGYPAPARRLGNLRFASGLRDAAVLAGELLGSGPATQVNRSLEIEGNLRAVFVGGTLAQEALFALGTFLGPLASNLKAPGVEPLADPNRSFGHTVVDLGDDVLTVGRLHPMMDLESTRKRLLRESEDPHTGALLFDVVLGDGAHQDPLAELESALQEIHTRRPRLPLLAVVVGSPEDPQDLDTVKERLEEIGVRTFGDVSEAVSVLALAQWISEEPTVAMYPSLDPADFVGPLTAINAGVEVFHQSLLEQGANSLQMDWRPPAGGREELLAILEKMRATP